MKLKTRYRLIWIRAMMVVSQVLLIVLICSWLFSQYDDEKATLQKDLNAALSATKQKVADSLIMQKFVKPLVSGLQNTSSKNINIKYSSAPALNVPHSEFVLVADDSNNVEINKETGDVKIRGLRATNSKNKPQTKVVRHKKVVSTDLDEQAREKLAMPLVSAVMQELVNEGFLPDESEHPFSKMDTTRFHYLFAKRMEDNGWNFNTTWLKTRKQFAGSDKHMLLQTDFYGKLFFVQVSGYESYLVKMITPQILFTLILLSLTAMAFLVTYRTLREQMRLSSVKNEFISNMSHELKTPISTVKVALEALTNFNMMENPVITREYLQMASHEMNRLDMLVNQTLNAALLEEGKLVVRKEKEDLQQILSDTVRVLQIRIQQYQASVQVNAEGNNFLTEADRLHIQGVLVNLIDNGLKYSGNNPEITIDIREKERQIEISVSDNGPGIPEEYLNKVYDKFFRVPTDNRHNVKGYGLGLSYAYQIMQQHNGQITAHNRKEGGCTFTLTFPKA
ncbi:MAG: HAMP domain-containing histidine kinase [Sphingobacteriales bacterium]|nr:MAG: HAMP domain-containing histidine kinase [Sphingobacteriales bacterium]